MGFTCEKCCWWADVNGVCVCGYSGRPTTRHDSCTAWKTSIVTNADNIRYMTDEELAGFCEENVCPPSFSASDCLSEKMREPNPDECRDCWLKWLREEVKE